MADKPESVDGVSDRCDREETNIPSDMTASVDVPCKRIMSPEAVRPYPKRKCTGETSRKGREKGKSRVYTDSPEKNRLEKLNEEKERKHSIKLMKQKAKELNSAKNLLGLNEIKKTKNKTSASRAKAISSDSDMSVNESLKLSDTDDEDWVEADEVDQPEEELEVPNYEKINVGAFLLVKFEKKKSVLYYVAEVISKYSLSEYHRCLTLEKYRNLICLFFRTLKTSHVSILKMLCYTCLSQTFQEVQSERHRCILFL